MVKQLLGEEQHKNAETMRFGSQSQGIHFTFFE